MLFQNHFTDQSDAQITYIENVKQYQFRIFKDAK